MNILMTCMSCVTVHLFVRLLTCCTSVITGLLHRFRDIQCNNNAGLCLFHLDYTYFAGLQARSA